MFNIRYNRLEEKKKKTQEILQKYTAILNACETNIAEKLQHTADKEK